MFVWLADHAATVEPVTWERILLAVLISTAATVALPIGAAIGIYARPSQWLVAIVMAFGSGALVQALAIELAFDGARELIVDHLMNPITAWVYVASGFVLGGFIFYLANRALESNGAHLRKPSLASAYLLRNRHRWSNVLHKYHLDNLPLLVRHGPQHSQEREHELLGPMAKEEHGSGAPMAIFVGALLDGIPESIVIGASFTTLAAFNPGFVVAVFMNNLPEAMSSAAGMRRSGFTPRRILSMWGGLMVASGVATALGLYFLSGAPPAVSVFVNAFAGGGILAMLATTMMPEAYEEGGAAVGIATIAGFLSAFLFTALYMH